jgi:hypothetical protein
MFQVFQMFSDMLQVFHMDVAEVERDVAKCSGGILQVFQRHVTSIFYMEVTYVLHICCKSMSEMFQLFQSYAAISVFMLQVASVLSRYCICFTHILQVYFSKYFICFKHILH